MSRCPLCGVECTSPHSCARMKVGGGMLYNPAFEHARGVVGDLFGGLGDGIGEPDRERWADHDADFTPPAVVRQGLQAIARELGTPTRLWDPCAGAGVFGQVARDLYGDRIRMHATELRVEELEHLERHYDSVTIGDALEDEQSAIERVLELSPDTVATNPAWNVWTSIAEVGLANLRLGGWMALLGPVAWGSSFEPAEGLDFMVAHPPVLELRIPGRIRYRTGVNPRTGRPYGSDHRKCAWWVWLRGESAAINHARAACRTSIVAWSTAVLPPLPAEALRWTTRPGTGTLPW